MSDDLEDLYHQLDGLKFNIGEEKVTCLKSLAAERREENLALVRLLRAGFVLCISLALLCLLLLTPLDLDVRADIATGLVAITLAGSALLSKNFKPIIGQEVEAQCLKIDRFELKTMNRIATPNLEKLELWFKLLAAIALLVIIVVKNIF